MNLIRQIHLTAATVLLYASAGLAGPTSQAAQRHIDPKAEQVLRQAAAYGAAIHSFRVEATVTTQVTTLKDTHPETMKYLVALRKPDHLAIVQQSQDNGCSIVSDGRNVYTCIPLLGRYAIDKVKTPGDTPPAWYLSGAGAGVGGVISQALDDEPYKGMFSAEATTRHVGIETIDGTPCHHIQSHTLPWDHDLWLEAGDRPLVRKSAWTHNRYDASRRVQPAPSQTAPETVMLYGSWQVDVDLSDDVFRFSPAPGTRQGRKFTMQELGNPALCSLAGKPAPIFAATLLDGGQMVLSKFKGRVVLLDFWEGRYDPCVQSMLCLGELARQYEDKPFSVCAINRGDKPEYVRRVVSQAGVQIPVAVDPLEATAKRYGVRFSPVLILIGKDGTVQYVEVGYDAKSKTTLQEKIETLLSGRNLVTETP